MANMAEKERLRRVLDYVFRFPLNANIGEVLEKVYGSDEADSRGHKAYVESKRDMIERKGFMWWYCDLDTDNQNKVAGMMLDRYGDDLLDLIICYRQHMDREEAW